MTKYKLTYFNFRVRGEVIRMLLAMGEVEYEDVRFDRPEFPAIKPSMPFGQTPVLEVDGKQIAQSLAIERYLAEKFGLAGGTSMEKARVDAFVDALQDLRVLADAEFRTQIPELKLTRADISLMDTASYLQAFHSFPTFGDSERLALELTKYPRILQLVKRVEAVPQIAEWINKRPKTMA